MSQGFDEGHRGAKGNRTASNQLAVSRSFVVSTVLALVAFAAVRFWTGWQILALVLAVSTGLGCLIAQHIWQSRGRVSLRAMAIGLPIVVAVGCWIYLQLTPFRRQHLAVEQLQRTNLNVRTLGFGGSWGQITPTYSFTLVRDEWVRDSKNRPFPIWMVKLVGNNSMKRVDSLSGQLSDFQSAAIYGLELDSLYHVDIRRSRGGPAFSTQFIQWLCSCPRLGKVQLHIEALTVEDQPALELMSQFSTLDEAIKVTIDLNHCDAKVDLSPLPRNCIMQAEVVRLDASRAEQLSGIRWLDIKTQSVSPDALRAFHNLTRLGIADCVFDERSAAAVTELAAPWLVMQNCTFPRAFDVSRPTSETCRIQRLVLWETTVNQDPLYDWVKNSRVAHLFMSKLTDVQQSKELSYRFDQLEHLQTVNAVPIVTTQVGQ
jgi:hypothetical protein